VGLSSMNQQDVGLINILDYAFKIV